MINLNLIKKIKIQRETVHVLKIQGSERGVKTIQCMFSHTSSASAAIIPLISSLLHGEFPGFVAPS